MSREDGSARLRTAAALLVGVLAAAVYVPTLGHGFVFDDGPEVVDNVYVRSLAHVGDVFASTAWKGAGDENPIYRPLTTLTFALNHAVSGPSPATFHATNVLLHAIASWLVLALALRLGLSTRAATLAGLLFALHPVHVEAVANVAGRKDVLATVLVLAMVLAHASALRGSRLGAITAPLAFVAAALAKETGIVGLPLVLARDALLARDDVRSSRRTALVLYGVYAASAVAYLALRRSVVGSFGVPLAMIPFVENPLAGAPLGDRLATAVAVIGRGIALVILPAKLSPDYSYAAIPATTLSDPFLLLGLAAILVAAAGIVAFRRTWPAGSFGLLWYAIALVPGSNVLTPVGTIFGERLLYLPSVGISLLAGAAASRLLDRRPGLVRWALALAGVALAVRTLAYERYWSDELSLFSMGVREQPRSVKMRSCLGAEWMERGRPVEAVPHLEAALALVRGTPEPLPRHLLELGVAYEAVGRVGDAVRLYEEALRADPRDVDAMWRLGVARWAEGRRPEAIALWRRVLDIDPRHARATSDLGVAFAVEGNEAAAASMWERATSLDPRLALTWYRLGHVYDRRGDAERARGAWRAFLREERDRYPRERAEVQAKLAAMDRRAGRAGR